MKFGTKAVHAGVEPDPLTGAVMTPIYQTSTYAQEAPGKHKGYEYARTQNPTRTALETNLAALENGTYGICFGSGLAAMDAILKRLSPGDEVISTNDLYGGSYRLIKRVYEKYDIKSHFIDLMDEAQFEAALNENTKLIWVETPTNPMLNIVDIEAVVKRTAGSNALVCVDNTFASPYLQNPLDLGADMVLHSATKYINGHSDVILGAIVVKDKALADDFYFLQNAAGAVPSPNDCFLTLRGIKTLHLRVEQACKSAKQIAEVLRVHPKVANVYWPGFKTHRGHAIAKAQMKRFGGMVSFDLVDDTFDNASKLLSSTKLFTLAESLGGVESLIGHPATMTHASIPREERLAVGLTDSLIRLSIGVEDTSDLVEDLAVALSKV
ncbi:MAG: cystathionine gamma-synthase [Bacteroidota bacterium]